jgi:hypothetical protein
MFEVDVKRLYLNACINGVSPKHRLKSMHSILPEKLTVNSDRHSSTIKWAQNQTTIIQKNYGAV